MSNAMNQLIEEHAVIERMLAVLKAAAEQAERGEQVAPETFLAIIDFIRNFADRCHHAKEEEILFKVLEKRGFAMQSGPIAVMLMEHDQGRLFTRNLESAVQRFSKGDESARKDLVFNALSYVNLLSKHIYKENNILFHMADQMLTSHDHENLEQEFDRIEKEMTGEGVHEKYHHLLHELEARFNLQ